MLCQTVLPNSLRKKQQLSILNIFRQRAQGELERIKRENSRLSGRVALLEQDQHETDQRETEQRETEHRETEQRETDQRETEQPETEQSEMEQHEME